MAKRIADLIHRDHIICDLKSQTKKQALEEISAFAQDFCDLDQRRLFDVFIERERLGSTALGQNAAVPHGVFEELDQIYGFFARLDAAIPFDAPDDKDVDLIFALIVPENDTTLNLKILSRLSRFLKDEDINKALHDAENVDELYSVFDGVLPDLSVHDIKI